MKKSALVLGGAGALGRGVVSRFVSRYSVLSIDLQPNEDAHFNYSLTQDKPIEEHIPPLKELIEEELNAEKRQFRLKLRGVDAIICTAGGFVAGSGKDDDLFEKWRIMNNQLIKSSLLTYHLATIFLKPAGICVFTGAHAAFADTNPELLAYHTGKVATHNIALNLANSTQIPENARVLTILPEMIKTPANEAAMPDEDWSKHPSPQHISELLYGWISGKSPPLNGSFARLKYEYGVCVPEFL